MMHLLASTFHRRMARHPRIYTRSLGQNFLMDDAILRRIVEASGLGPCDAALEVGPGLGSLTRHLVAEAAYVTAVEKDDALYARLVDTLTEVGGACASKVGESSV